MTLKGQGKWELNSAIVSNIDTLVPRLYQLLMKKIERVKTGLRIEKRLLKVLKGLAEHLDMSVAEVIEGMSLHAFEGKAPFSQTTLEKIEQLKSVYDLDLTAEDSHALTEKE